MGCYGSLGDNIGAAITTGFLGWKGRGFGKGLTSSTTFFCYQKLILSLMLISSKNINLNAIWCNKG